MHAIRNITISPEILKLIAEIDEFKGRWTVIETLANEPDRLANYPTKKPMLPSGLNTMFCAMLFRSL